MNALIPLALVLLIAGCATPRPPARVVKVESDPPGARVFFGSGPNENFANNARQYIGTTPFDWTPAANGDGSFKLGGALVYSSFVPPAAVIMAEPPHGATNLFPQRQVFHGGTIATPADKIPPGVFFDMHKPNP